MKGHISDSLVSKLSGGAHFERCETNIGGETRDELTSTSHHQRRASIQVDLDLSNSANPNNTTVNTGGKTLDSLDTEKQAIPAALDVFKDLSHHSLDLGMFPGDDSFDGGLSVSSLCFHDSQENVDTRKTSSSPICIQDMSGNIMNLFQGIPNSDILPHGTTTVSNDHFPTERLISDEDSTKASRMDIHCIDTGAMNMVSAVTSGEHPTPFNGNGVSSFPSSITQTDNTLNSPGKNTMVETQFQSQPAYGFSFPGEQSSFPGKEAVATLSSNGGSPPSGNSLVHRPNSYSALVSESGTTVTAASIRNEGGQNQQYKESTFHFVPNTVQLKPPGANEERNVVSYDSSVPGPARSFMQDNTPQSFGMDMNANMNQNQYSSPNEDMIREQHRLSFMKWQEENFPGTETLSQRRLPASMRQEPEFPVPASRARQGRRFSMPALSSLPDNYAIQEKMQDMEKKRFLLDLDRQQRQHQHPQILENHDQIDDEMSRYTYATGNGDPYGNVPTQQIQHSKQSRRFSMPTYSSSMNNNDHMAAPSFDTSSVPRRRQARRLSNDSLSNSVHDHVAHIHSMEVLSSQANMQDAMDPSCSVRRRQSRRCSNDSFASSYQSDTTQTTNTMQSQCLTNQQGGMQFPSNSIDRPVMMGQQQARRFSMPTFSSNPQELRFQTQQSMANSSSLLLPLSAVTSQLNPQQNPIFMNCGVNSTYDEMEKSTAHNSISPYLDVSLECPGSFVINSSDRELATDFSFAVLSEVEACTFGKQDRTGKRRSLPLGFQGLACRHCRGLSKIGGRLFPSTIKTMSDTNKTLMALYNHLIKCPVCPNNKKMYLKYLKDSHENERKNKRYGSQKALFSKIWKRLHGKVPPV